MEIIEAVFVGCVIRDLRKKMGMSQEVLSGFADIGRTHLSMIERGERKPTLETFYKIADALQVKPSQIMIEIERLQENERNH